MYIKYIIMTYIACLQNVFSRNFDEKNYNCTKLTVTVKLTMLIIMLCSRNINKKYQLDMYKCNQILENHPYCHAWIIRILMCRVMLFSAARIQFISKTFLHIIQGIEN